jgi:hypothetical protein
MLSIIKEDVNFHTFETLEKDNVIDCVCRCVIFQFIQQPINFAMAPRNNTPTILLSQVANMATEIEHEQTLII